VETTENCCGTRILISTVLSFTKKEQMECGLSAYQNSGASANGSTPSDLRSPSKGHKDLHVNFETGKVEVQERKKKFLTAKYGTHQMNLIKKRLSVEMWMYDELQFLYNTGSDDDCEVELDLDELLDVEGGDTGKRHWLQEKLVNAKQSQEEVKKFIEELMKRAKTL